MAGLIKFHEVYRDAIQSLFGTNPSAQEIVDAHQHAHEVSMSAIQTNGGTFFDSFARKGRDEWKEIDTIASFFKEKNVRQTALVRGDFLVGFEPQPYDVILAFVREYAKAGINVLQNFHGLNDTRVLEGVAKAAQEVRTEGYDIIAQGTICIEDNTNITIESCLQTARELIAMGHEGFYLKSASGVVKPDFVRELTAKLLDQFPDQQIGIHVHSTYGEAPVCYMAAIKEAVNRGKTMEIDVQHPAMAGSTAHPSSLKMLQLIQNHPNPTVRENAPQLDIDAIKADMDALFRLRFEYRDCESAYNHDLLEAMRAARAPGGASSTLGGISGLKENLGRVLGTDDWDQIQIAIYKMQKEILADLGDSTQVTPYAANTTGQAGLSLYSKLSGKDIYDTLYPGIINYLVGRHGRVPDTVNPKLVEQALKQTELNSPVEYVTAAEKPSAMDDLKQQLKDAGIEEPTDRQAISLAIGGPARMTHIIACHNGTNQPQQPPALPDFAQPAQLGGKIRGKTRVKTNGPEHIVKAIGGYGELQKLAERALHLKQIDDDLYEFPEGEECLKSQWRDDNLRAITRFLDSVPEKLKDAGFKSFNGVGSTLKAPFHLKTFDTIFRDVCGKKGPKLYKHMMEAVETFRAENNHEPLEENPKIQGGAQY
tara:strand:+ start:2956 stop:4911 length:1956 start_codon:yes stop_codon:yes gene_type:complete